MVRLLFFNKQLDVILVSFTTFLSITIITNMKKPIIILLSALTWGFQLATAQSVGKPDGNVSNFFTTNSFGRLLGHREAGSFGSFGTSDQWIGIGQPFTGANSGVKVPAYGMRSQWSGQTGIFSLKGSGTTKDLAIEWGSSTASRFRISFVQDPTNPAALNEVMTMSPLGQVGIGNTSPFATLDVRTDVTSRNYGIRNTFDTRNITFTGISYGIYNLNQGDTGGKRGIYNNLTGADGGSDYGVYNYVFNSNGSARGSYSNTFVQGGSGAVYGTYQNGYHFGGTGAAYGTYSYAYNSGSGNTYGVYSRVSSAGTGQKYAGYFVGNVYVSGSISQASDRAFKNDIQVLSKKEIVSKIMELKPSKYTYVQDKNMQFEDGLQYGFVAQEMEEVFPDLVKDIEQPLFEEVENEEGEKIQEMTGTVKYKSVNYIGMIPILTKALQEHEEALAAQKSLNEQLSQQVQELLLAVERAGISVPKSTPEQGVEVKNSLGQNIPNPFNQDADIQYTLASSVKEGIIQVYDLNGNKVAEYTNLSAGANTIKVESGSFKPGVYVYVMLADGQTIGTKRMIVTK